MNSINHYKNLVFPREKTKFYYVLLILFLLIMDDITIHVTGGTKFAYLHLLYIPILLGGFFFSIRGGILVGLLAGLLLGPAMPLDEASASIQPFASWVLRLALFSLIGFLAGAGSSIFRAYLFELEAKHKTNPISGLPNIYGLSESFDLLRKGTSKNGFSIVVAELSHMEELDHALGEEGIQELIRKLALTLTAGLGEKGVLGHIQSGKFVILVPKNSNVLPLLKTFQKNIKGTTQVGDIPVFTEVRFGVSCYPADDRDLNQLVRKATSSLNRIENLEQQISFFTAPKGEDPEKNLILLHKFKGALENKTLEIAYQPKFNIQNNSVTGLEALLRWTDPELGSISPEFFIPLVEKTLLIRPLTEWLVKTVVKQMKIWQENDLLVPVSVNFSVKNLYSSHLLKVVETSLKANKISPSALEIEVTETAITSSLEVLSKKIREFRGLGVHIAIDDFGTGQASQHYLLELPINTIKIDKVFTQALFDKESAKKITRNAISLAHELGVKVVAEGVESQEQYDLLKSWECDSVQGFLVSKALFPDDAMKWLKAQKKKGQLSFNILQKSSRDQTAGMTM